MITMQLALNIDAQKFIQQVQMNNQMVEEEVQKGLDNAFAELSQDGTIEKMIKEAVKRNIMDSFSRWIFQSNIRTKVEKQQIVDAFEEGVNIGMNGIYAERFSADIYLNSKYNQNDKDI